MWVNDIESIVFTRVRVGCENRLKTKYPNIDFTTSTKERKEPKFPTVYVHMMNSQEIGRTLDGKHVNGVNATFQIEVTDNTRQYNADFVADAVCDVMKEMMFEIVGTPYVDESNPSVYRNVARFRRPIGASDTF